MDSPQGLDEFLSGSAPAQAAAPAQAHPSNEPPGLNEFIQQEQYGTPVEQAKAAAEGLLRGVTLGGSDIAETKLGISTPEAVSGRKAANPWTSGGTNFLGSAALLGATGGLAAPVEGALLAKGAGSVAARAAAYGLEGGVIGGGNVVSDAALGDHDLNAQKILGDIGFGVATSAGLGVLSKAVEALPAIFRRGKVPEGEIPPSILGDAPGGPPPGSGGAGAPVMDAPTGKAGVQPTSLEDIAAKTQEAIKSGDAVAMPQKAPLLDAASRVPLDNAIHPLQVNSLDSQAERDLYKTALEMPGKEGDALRNHEALQKNELVDKTDEAIKDIAPWYKSTPDAVKGGEHANERFKQQYQEEQNNLIPKLNEMKKTGIGTEDHLPGVIQIITDAVPGVARMFDTTGAEISVNPYKSSWGIDKATYNAAKEAVTALEEGPVSVKELFNIRKGLDQHVDVMSQGQAPGEIRAMKAAMMDHIQNVVEKHIPDVEVRDTMRRYAINEQQRDIIEKNFGASVGKPELGGISKIKPESIGDKIFSNTANVKAAKQILDPEVFQEILANHLSEARQLATDKGAFSSNKFASFIKRNQDALGEAFKDNPEKLQRLNDLNTIMRILPDSPSINPSGTAKTLAGILKATDIHGLLKNAAEYGKEKFTHQATIDQINASLAGKADAATKLGTINNILKRQSQKIDKGAKSIFNKD